MKFKTYKQFREAFEGFSTGGKFPSNVNRFASANYGNGEKWFFAMDYCPGFGWEGVAAYRADTDELFTQYGVDGPSGMKADDELVASYGSSKSDCIDAMMGC